MSPLTSITTPPTIRRNIINVVSAFRLLKMQFMYIIVSTENIDLCFAVFIYRSPCHAAHIIGCLAFFTLLLFEIYPCWYTLR